MSLTKKIGLGLAGVAAFAVVAVVGTSTWATPGPGVIRKKAGCVRIARKPKKARCVACIAKGGHFHKVGGKLGYCNPRK